MILRHVLLTAMMTLAGFGTSATQAQDARLAQARTLFETYMRLERAFDPALVDLYAPAAVIHNTRRYPDGTTRALTLTTAQLRLMLPQALPIAKRLGDTNTYADVSYAVEGAGVRIRATRFATLKGYTSPVSMLVRPTPTGTWQIVEELSESRP